MNGRLRRMKRRGSRRGRFSGTLRLTFSGVLLEFGAVPVDETASTASSDATVAVDISISVMLAILPRVRSPKKGILPLGVTLSVLQP